MVLTPPMVFSQTDGIVSVFLDHTRTRGPSIAHMRDFFFFSLTLCLCGVVRQRSCLVLVINRPGFGLAVLHLVS